MKVYCDTCIFLDYFLDRKDNIRPLNELAFNFFSRGWNCSFELVISNWLLKELRNHLSEEKIESILTLFREKNKLFEVHTKKGDWNLARNLSSNNSDDALHAILAKRGNADYLVTRNFKHIGEFDSLIKICFPEFVL